MLVHFLFLFLEGIIFLNNIKAAMKSQDIPAFQSILWQSTNGIRQGYVTLHVIINRVYSFDLQLQIWNSVLM